MSAVSDTSLPRSRHMPWLTLAMLLTNLAAYVWQAVRFGHFDAFSTEEQLMLGANVASLTLTEAPLHLLTSLFLHADLPHLLTNLFVLAIIGTALEARVARWRWLFIYLLGGVMANIVSAAWHFDSVSIGLLQETRTLYLICGASGSIMALAGAMVVLALGQRETLTNQLTISALFFTALAVVSGVLVEDADNVSHVVGLSVGALVCLPLLFKRLGAQTIPILAVGTGVTLVMLVVVGQSFRSIDENPDAEDIRALAREFVQQLERQAALVELRQREQSEHVATVSQDMAQGVTIPLAGIVRIVPTADPQRVWLLKNNNESRLIEYDLKRNVALRVLIDRPYDGDDLWGCPFDQCYGVGISDLLLDEAAGKAYVSSLIKGHVSRVDLSSGAVDYSVATGRFPSQLARHGAKLYALDWADNRLSILDSGNGTLLETLQLPGESSSFDWPQSGSLALTDDGAVLYLLDADHNALRLNLSDNTFTQVDAERSALAMGKSTSGKVWFLFEDGIRYGDGALQPLTYRVDDYARQSSLKETLVETAAGQPLILHPLEISGTVLGLSGNSGQTLRQYPTVNDALDMFSLMPLGPNRAYITGRSSTQVLNIEHGVALDEAAEDYEQARLHIENEQAKRNDPTTGDFPMMWNVERLLERE